MSVNEAYLPYSLMCGISLGKHIFYIWNERIHYWDTLKSFSQLIPEHPALLSVSLHRCHWEKAQNDSGCPTEVSKLC